MHALRARRMRLLRAVSLPLLLVSSLWAQQTATLAIVGGQIVDGSGAPPIADGVVLIEGKRIARVGGAKEITVPAGAKTIDAGGMTVMPGLIDMHVHLGLIGHADEEHFVRIYKGREENEIIPAGARQHLMNGVTTIRDVGSPISVVKVRDRINRGELVGTRMFVSGPMLQRRPRDILIGWSWNVADIKDARSKVKKLVAAGVDWVKVHDQMNFSDAELRAIVDEARAAGKPVAGHGYSRDEEMLRAIRFGFKTLEHPGLGAVESYGDEAIREVIRRDTCIVPTSARRTIFSETEQFPARLNDRIAKSALPPDVFASMRESLADFWHLPNADKERRWIKNLDKKVRPFIERGACVVVGTDSGEPLLFQGSSTWYEIKNLVGFGMTPTEAITAATSRPGKLLAADIGELRPGFRADLILVKGDVLENVELLQNVTHVIKDGVQYK